MPYLAMVLPFVLQHLLQVQTTGQVALSQMVAELRNTEQSLLRAHCFTVCEQEYKHRKKMTKSALSKKEKHILKYFTLKCSLRGSVGLHVYVMTMKGGRHTQNRLN